MRSFRFRDCFMFGVAFSSGCGCFLNPVLGAFAARCAGRVLFNEASELVGER